MRSCFFAIAASLLTLPAVNGATFVFNTDPFAGAILTAGRDIVGNEQFDTFDPDTDLFSLESTVFGTGSQLNFIRSLAANLPTGGVNVIALQDQPAALAAGSAAALIAAQITDPGPGFFIYFNTTLGLPRLVFSTDLSDPTADLKILFRMTNLTGDTGRTALGEFDADNFQITTAPEPSSLVLVSGFLLACVYAARRKRSGADHRS